jgi:hypothetical protein
MSEINSGANNAFTQQQINQLRRNREMAEINASDNKGFTKQQIKHKQT